MSQQIAAATRRYCGLLSGMLHTLLQNAPDMVMPWIKARTVGWPGHMSGLTHFAQSPKMGTVTTGFDTRLVNRPFLILTYWHSGAQS